MIKEIVDKFYNYIFKNYNYKLNKSEYENIFSDIEKDWFGLNYKTYKVDNVLEIRRSFGYNKNLCPLMLVIYKNGIYCDEYCPNLVFLNEENPVEDKIFILKINCMD